MKPLMQKIWTEPAAAIGLLTSLVLLGVAVISDANFNTQTLLGIAAPLLSGLGIRQTVYPVAGPRPVTDTPSKESP